MSQAEAGKGAAPRKNREDLAYADLRNEEGRETDHGCSSENSPVRSRTEVNQRFIKTRNLPL